MVITNIEPQKKNRGRQSVYLDGTFAFGIDDFDLFRLKLKVGQELSEESLGKIRETVLFSRAKDYALKLISARRYTRAGMTKKLEDREIDRQTIEKTLAFLEEYRYIDDYEYTRCFVNDSIHIKKHGKFKIRNALKEKGVPADIIERVLGEYNLEEMEQGHILELARKRLAGNFEYKNVMKVKRYLVSRGYSFEAVDVAVGQIINSDGEWDEC